MPGNLHQLASLYAANRCLPETFFRLCCFNPKCYLYSPYNSENWSRVMPFQLPGSFTLLLAICGTLSAVHTVPQIGRAQEMRIETDVFLADSEESISHTVTLFDTGTVYDFVEHPARVAVFRSPNQTHEGQFILLDLVSQQRTDIDTGRIVELIDKLTKWAAEQEDPLLKFSSDPEFEESFDKESGQLTLTSELWTYKVATVPAENHSLLKRYRLFTDWYTRLNTMLQSSPPPGPRLKLNETLEKHEVFPVEIHRTVNSKAKRLRATHLFTWRLSREDRARIDEVRQHLAKFEKVDNESFVTRNAPQNIVRGQSSEE